MYVNDNIIHVCWRAYILKFWWLLHNFGHWCWTSCSSCPYSKCHVTWYIISLVETCCQPLILLSITRVWALIKHYIFTSFWLCYLCAYCNATNVLKWGLNANWEFMLDLIYHPSFNILNPWLGIYLPHDLRTMILIRQFSHH